MGLIARRLLAGGLVTAGCAAGGYLALATGTVAVNLGIGRRIQPLGPSTVDIRAPRNVVFDLIAQPYLGRRTRAMADKIEVLQAGADLVLAAHHTPIHGRLKATTVETVRFTRPERIDFQLVRGPVPHVAESFTLTESDQITQLAYHGELGTDLWALGQAWGTLVATRWRAVVADTLSTIKTEAERRASHRG